VAPEGFQGSLVVCSQIYGLWASEEEVDRRVSHTAIRSGGWEQKARSVKAAEFCGC